MKIKIFAWVIVFVMLFLVACVGTVTTSPGNQDGDYLEQLIQARETATAAALRLQSNVVRSTTIAEATSEFMLLQAKQTRLIRDDRATQTAQVETSTANALHVSQTQVSISRTLTADNTTRVYQSNVATVSASETRAADTKTVTYQSNVATASVSETRAAQTPTAYAVAQAQELADAKNKAEIEKANWDRNLESIKAIAFLALILGVIVGVCVVVGFGALRFIDAYVLRARIVRGKTGAVFVIGEKDKDGRQIVFAPERSPGAVISISPPGIAPLLSEPQSVDAETTKRDQAISLMLAATNGKGGGDEVMAQLSEGDNVRFVDEPPAQLVSDDTKLLIDGDWSKE